ncbi:acetyltransferase (GNAT) family protein [Comamonas sp. BIGb0124]|uniref:GNAT family N-acetyltransferase n=1 Tax=Comamonas sp. BIGb0124 TaxID=2485130 RepID=UPI000F4666DF|nr:GNAT family N-acetyltransferase [Comamonas sp. BIGb0124]ROR16335.1 acetyltransferase (GNAT) family protein [Comamonas sp. BIGb0124]
MTESTAFLKATLHMLAPWMRAPGEASVPVAAMVPIRTLAPNHRSRILAHLLALDEHDRYLRFGYTATDEQVERYVTGLNFERDEVFGIFNRSLELVAMAHLAYSTHAATASCAEFGVSVLKSARGRGYGGRLFERAAMHARNEGVNMLFIHALSENSAMLRIARKAGATVQRDGSESEAHLQLAAPNLDSRLAQILHEQYAEADYKLKKQARHFWDLLGLMQDVRTGVRDARQRSAQ